MGSHDGKNRQRRSSCRLKSTEQGLKKPNKERQPGSSRAAFWVKKVRQNTALTDFFHGTIASRQERICRSGRLTEFILVIGGFKQIKDALAFLFIQNRLERF